MRRMRHASPTLLLTLIIVGVSSGAHAQDPGQIGLTTGYPASIGVIWHVTDQIAVRPDFTFSTSSTELATSETNSTTGTFGLSGLFYVAKWDALRTYVSPRFVYSRTSSENNPNLPGTARISTTVTSKSLTGSAGAQFAAHKRFSVFGEAGFGYSSSNISPASPNTGFGSRGHTWGTRTAVGIILYF